MRSIGHCRQRVSLVFPLSQHSYSRDLDFHNFSSPGLAEVEDDTFDGTLQLRLIIGLDFAVTRSSLLNLVEVFSPLFQNKLWN